MAKYRRNLPILTDELFVTDGGLETYFMFHKGWELPENAAFVLLETEEGRQALSDYYMKYLLIAEEHKTGLILESPTWRASFGWLKKMNYSKDTVLNINFQAIELLQEIRENYETDQLKIVISGCIGPRGDGYVVNDKMTIDRAESYHTEQINILSQTEADMVSAFTLNYVEEAIGIVRASNSANLPVVISFTVETDGKLPSGQTLKDAIEQVDRATYNAPAYYMINCAHPIHIRNAFTEAGSWMDRIRAIRANASSKSHMELEQMENLDEGDPSELGNQYKELKAQLNHLNVLGGCCGTDHRHINEICNIYLS